MPTHTAEKEVEIAEMVSKKLATKWKLHDGPMGILGMVWVGVHRASQNGNPTGVMSTAGVRYLIDQFRHEKTNEGQGRRRGKVPKIVSLSLKDEWANDIQDDSHDDHPLDPLLAGWCRTSHLRQRLDWKGRIVLYLMVVEKMGRVEAAACFNQKIGGQFWKIVDQVRKDMKERIKQEGLY